MYRSVIVALVVAVFAGCGDSGTSESVTSAASENGPLAQVGGLYLVQWQTKKKAPAGVKDFDAFADSMPEGVNAVKQGDVVVIWGVKLDDLSLDGTGDSADEVLAYEKGVPDAGGYVLMKNRKIRQMTADEFKAAPKAAGTTEDASAKSSKAR